MAVNPLVGQLFSLNGQEPAPLPDRVFLGRETAYLNAEAELGNVLSAEDLAEHGYTGPIQKPAYDVYRQTLVWDEDQYRVADLSEELRTAMWDEGRTALNAEIAELTRIADLRSTQLTAAGKSTAAVDAFKTRLAAAEASSGCPMEVVLPPTAILYFENSPSLPHFRSLDWCIENWVSDVDKGYMAQGGVPEIEIHDQDLFDAFLETNKEAINLYAMGDEFQALVYPTRYVDNLDRTGTITVELAGDATGYTYSVNGGEAQAKSDSELTFNITGTGEHQVTLAATSAGGEGNSYTKTFYVQ